MGVAATCAAGEQELVAQECSNGLRFLAGGERLRRNQEADGDIATTTQSPITTSRGRTAGRRRRLLIGSTAAVIGVTVVLWGYLTVPAGNEDKGPVDVLLVLGTPTDITGALSRPQRWRVDEAVREYRRGRAAHILISGGMTTRTFVEADTMARYARQLGVPAEAIAEERRSRTTVENVRNSLPILKAHGWRRVEVISSAEHLPRAALLLERTPLLWRTHAAPTPGRSRLQIAGAYAEEAVGTTALRIFGLKAEPVLHAYAVVQNAVLFGVRWVLYKTEGLAGKASR